MQRHDMFPRHIPPQRVIDKARHAEPHTVNHHSWLRLAVRANELGRERDEGDAHHQEQIQQQRPAVYTPDEMKECVVIEPQDANDSETRDVAQQVRPELQQAMDRFSQSGTGNVGHFDFDDQQGDDDGEYGVGERLEARETHRRVDWVRVSGFVHGCDCPPVNCDWLPARIP